MTDSMSDQIKVREISPFFISWIFINKNCFMKQIFEILQEERDRILNIHESSTKNQYLNTLIVEEKETELITEGQYVTKNFNKLGKSNKYPWALPKNVVFEPSKKLVGYLIGKAKFVYSRRGSEWDREDINYVQYKCSKGKFSIGKGEGYYDYDLYNETLSKALKPLCNESMSRTQSAEETPVTPQTPVEDQGNKKNGEKKIYEVIKKQIASSCKSGKYIDFEPGTKFIYNDAKKIASFRMFKTNDKIWGWFSCKDNTFNFDKDLYGCKNDPFANVLQAKLCKSDKKEKLPPGGTDTGTVRTGGTGGTTVAKPTETALDTILQKISGGQKPSENKITDIEWKG